MHGWMGVVAVASVGLVCSCAPGQMKPGYVKAEDLESREQGPSHCAARCHELGMQMAALVLVSDQLPGCVCQPRPAAGAPAVGAPPGQGASATATGYVVLAAAAAEAARRQQEAELLHY